MNQISPVKLHNAEQGTDEWHQLRCGVLTASCVKHIVTPTLKLSANDKTRALANKIAIQRITGIPKRPSPPTQCCAATSTKRLPATSIPRNTRRSLRLALSPMTASRSLAFPLTGLVGADGLIEVKSRDPHLQFASVVAVSRGDGIPKEYMAQIQAGLLLSGRDWCDFLSFSHGLPMMRARVYPDPEYQEAIIEAAKAFEQTVQELIAEFQDATSDELDFTPTERIDYEGMIL